MNRGAVEKGFIIGKSELTVSTITWMRRPIFFSARYHVMRN